MLVEVCSRRWTSPDGVIWVTEWEEGPGRDGVSMMMGAARTKSEEGAAIWVLCFLAACQVFFGCELPGLGAFWGRELLDPPVFCCSEKRGVGPLSLMDVFHCAWGGFGIAGPLPLGSETQKVPFFGC